VRHEDQGRSLAILDVAVTPGQTNEGEMIEPQVDEVKATTGIDIKTVTADAGYAYAKVYGALERRDIDALIRPGGSPPATTKLARNFLAAATLIGAVY
jgi:TRAP-type uncharacterized transport system substrate-binding protein